MLGSVRASPAPTAPIRAANADPVVDLRGAASDVDDAFATCERASSCLVPCILSSVDTLP